MALLIVILGSVVLPAIVVILLLIWEKKMAARQSEKDKLINTMEEIITLKDGSIQKLRKAKP